MIHNTLNKIPQNTMALGKQTCVHRVAGSTPPGATEMHWACLSSPHILLPRCRAWAAPCALCWWDWKQRTKFIVCRASMTVIHFHFFHSMQDRVKCSHFSYLRCKYSVDSCLSLKWWRITFNLSWGFNFTHGSVIVLWLGAKENKCKGNTELYWWKGRGRFHLY